MMKNNNVKTLMIVFLLGLIAVQGNCQPAFKQINLTLEARVSDLLSRMTLEEKISQLGSNSAAVERLGISAFNWDNEGKHAFVTDFPASIGIAATWDTTMAFQIASAIADEARATNNRNIKEGKVQRYMCFWAPTINIARDPRWGRTNESYGEDPYLTSQMGISFIQGMQGNNPRYLKAVAGVNHYVLYNEERDRHSVNASLNDERLLRDYYLPHFKACIQKGGAAAVGATNNGYNGVPVCANSFLLTNILREEWGFKGFVFSDAGSVDDLYKTRKYVKTGAEGVALSVGSGCEISCSRAHQEYLGESVAKGLITEGQINEACRRVLNVRFRLGMFDPPGKVPYTQIGDSVIDCKEHRQLAVKAALESIVLLKNEKNILPLDISRFKTILVAGPRADQPELGRKQTGLSATNISALEGIKNRIKGLNIAVDYEKDPSVSPKKAIKADVIIYFTSIKEGEVCDRMNLDLPSHQENEMIELSKTGKPLIVVLIGGGCVTMEKWQPKVSALLSAWYPGEEGGTAIASILFGDFNPCGKLPLTFYKSEKQLLDFDDFNIKKGTTYWYMKEKPNYPFGFGLSYTKFDYSSLQIRADQSSRGNADLSFKVRNSGTRDGKEVAQLYIRSVERSTGDQPNKELKRFKKIDLKAGEEGIVKFKLTPEDFAFYDQYLNFLVEPGKFNIQIGSSSEDIRLNGEFSIRERTLLESAASFVYNSLQIDRTAAAPDELIAADVLLENIGRVTGRPKLLIDGHEYNQPNIFVGPGEKKSVRFTVRLYQPGEHEIRIGNLPIQKIRVKQAPATFVCSDLLVRKAIVAGHKEPISVTVTNKGGERGAKPFALLINDKESGRCSVELKPGESRQIRFNHLFNEPGNYRVSFSPECFADIQVGALVHAPFNTYSSAQRSEFRQVSATDFILTSSGEMGGCPVNKNLYAGVVEDNYSSIYLKGGMKDKSYAMVRILGRELTSNYTKTGIIIRNRIDQSGKSAGYVVMGVNGYFDGGGMIEWDNDADGYLDTIKNYNPGSWPKWIVIEKNGKSFSFFASGDQGATWSKIFSTTIESAMNLQDVGIFHVSDYKEKASTARFSDFTVTEGLFNGNIKSVVIPVEKKREQPL